MRVTKSTPQKRFLTTLIFLTPLILTTLISLTSVLQNVGDTNLLLVVCGQALGFAGAHFDDRMVKHDANSGPPMLKQPGPPCQDVEL